MIKIKEKDIQKQILDWLKLQPHLFVIRTNNIGVPMANGKFRPSPVKGLADILICYRGRFIALEVKRPGGKATEAQCKFLDNVNRAFGFGYIVTSLVEVQKILSFIKVQMILGKNHD
jgi:hypothetical protein